MPKRKIVLIAAAIALTVAVLGGVYLYVSGFTLDNLPRPVQRTYLSVYFKVTMPDLRPDSSFMKKAHEATKVRPIDTTRPYTFDYVAEDIEVLKKDSVRCEACHGLMLQYQDGKPKYPIHKKMQSVPLIKFHCTDCHKKVDLGRRRPGRATIRVDRTQCTRCHESDKDSTPAKAVAGAVIGDSDVPETFLISNHGIDKKSGKEWAAKAHAEVAKNIGPGKCRRCHAHDTELDFCDDCHGRDGLKRLPD